MFESVSAYVCVCARAPEPGVAGDFAAVGRCQPVGGVALVSSGLVSLLLVPSVPLKSS